MTLMSAARLYDPNEPFRIDRLEIPDPTGNDVLVRVRACGVVPNLANVIRYNEILPQLPIPDFPAIFGLDAAGEIAAVGPEVLGVRPGQRVYVNPGRSCGSCRRCRAGHITQCSSYAFQGYFGFGPASRSLLKRYSSGGFAEYMIAPASSLVVLPDEVNYLEASRFGYLGTAYAALQRARVGTDSTVLVNGATGTVGLGAVLVALAMGAPKILAVARNTTRLAELKALAPNRIVTHSNDSGPCTEWAQAQTDGEGPDVMIEAVSPGTPGEVTRNAIMSVARGGRIVTIGGSFEDVAINPVWFMTREVSFAGSLWFTPGQAEDMARMVAAGVLDLSPLQHQRFPLDQATLALKAACNREHGGLVNVVIEP